LLSFLPGVVQKNLNAINVQKEINHEPKYRSYLYSVLAI